MTRVRTLPKPVGTIYMGYGGQWMIVTEAGAVPYRRVA